MIAPNMPNPSVKRDAPSARPLPLRCVAIMIGSRVLFASALLLSSLHSIASERIDGKYQTVTESQCNFTLFLGANGRGSFTESCRREDGSHKDDLEKRKITWKAQGNVVTVIDLDLPTKVFTIHQSMSCQSFGGTGSAFGLRGYGEQEFWKVPRKCR